MVLGFFKKLRSRKNACLRILVITLGLVGMLLWALVVGLLVRPNLKAFDNRIWGYMFFIQLLLNIGYIFCTSVIIYSIMSKTFPSAHDLESVRANVARLVGLVFVGTAECIALFFLPGSDGDGDQGSDMATGNSSKDSSTDGYDRITVYCSLSFIWAIFVAASAWGLHQRFYTVMLRRMSVVGLISGDQRQAAQYPTKDHAAQRQITPYPTKDAHSAVLDSSHVHITPLVHGPPPIIINTEASVSPKGHSSADTRTPNRILPRSHVLPYSPSISPTHTPLPTPTSHDSNRPSGQPFPSPQNPSGQPFPSPQNPSGQPFPSPQNPSGQEGAFCPSTNRGAPPPPYGFTPC